MSASTRTQKKGEIVACEKLKYDRQGRGQYGVGQGQGDRDVEEE